MEEKIIQGLTDCKLLPSVLISIREDSFEAAANDDM